MARKINIPKAAQIRGLKKALRNRKTPRAFIPSLKKRLRALGGTLALLAALCGCAARPAAAQTPVIIQPTQQTLATATACTGSAQTFPVKNKNQSQHLASVIATGTMNMFAIEIDGIDDSGNVFRLSDIAQGNFGTTGTSVSAVGYYPKIQVVVTCTGTSFTLSYSGWSGSPFPSTGVAFGSQVNKMLFYAITGATDQTDTFQTPFGNSSGLLYFNYNSSAVAGSTIDVQCESIISGGVGQQFIFSIANRFGNQTFSVPPSSCPSASVVYSTGSASAGLVTLEYSFDAPGGAVNSSVGQYAHVTATTATAVKTTNGTVTAINLNTSAAGTISLFDLQGSSCTATPSTNTVAVLTIGATEIARQIPFESYFQNGICVKASAAMDFTVGFQ